MKKWSALTNLGWSILWILLRRNFNWPKWPTKSRSPPWNIYRIRTKTIVREISFEMTNLFFEHGNSGYKGKALKENPDRVFYLAYDFLYKNNPDFHHEHLYSIDKVQGQNRQNTPQINNITLKVKLKFWKYYFNIIRSFSFQLPSSPLLSQGEKAQLCDENSYESSQCFGNFGFNPTLLIYCLLVHKY